MVSKERCKDISREALDALLEYQQALSQMMYVRKSGKHFDDMRAELVSTLGPIENKISNLYMRMTGDDANFPNEVWDEIHLEIKRRETHGVNKFYYDMKCKIATAMLLAAAHGNCK